MRRAVLAVAVVLAGCAHGSMTAAPASTWISPLWNISGSNAQVTAVANFVAFGEGVTFNPAISAVDPASGNFRWSYSFPGFNQYTFAPQTFVCDVEPDILFAAVAGDYDGAYAAMNRSNGASLWLLPMSVQFVNEAQWLCPKVRGDPLVIVSTTVLYGADAQRGKLLYERYVNTTTSPQTFIVERCGPREATRCVVFQDAQGLHVLDAKTGQDVRRALSPLPFGGYAVASASNLVLLQAGDAVQALYWNGTVAWTAPSGTDYAGGNDKVWVSANNGYATGFSSVTGDVLWNWTNPCGTIHSPLPLNGEECQPQFTFFPVLPVASTYCFQNQGCSSAAFDAVTGEVKWYVANQTLSFVATGSKEYAVVSNNTDATVFNVATGSQRNVQVHSRVWGVASNDKVVILQNIFTLAFSRF